MIPRALLERVFAEAVARERAALPEAIASGLEASGHADRERHGLAIGKAALVMARGLGPVTRGCAISPHDDGEPLPAGWRLVVSSHPIVDDRAVVAGDLAIELVAGAPADAVIVALISGGASALVEIPLVPLPELVRITSSLMRLGVPIEDLNAVRIALSAIKGGRLAALSAAPVVTLAISDVIGDSLETIGSGPTVGAWLRGQPFDRAALEADQRSAALRVLRRHEIGIPRALERALEPTPLEIRHDFARVVVPMNSLARRVHAALARELPELGIGLVPDPFSGPVDRAAKIAGTNLAKVVAWGELTLVLPPDHGAGGRMQQLALALAKGFEGTARSAFAIGTDGIDGPPPPGRPAPAGAYVDGTTWDAIRARGIDPNEALRRRDAGTALDAVGALVITGPTGVNHADLVVIG